MADEEGGSGYKKPPQKNTFADKVSGNPKGRPKGSFGIMNRLRHELRSRNADGREVLDALLSTLVESAKNDQKLALKLLALVVKHDADLGDSGADEDEKVQM